MSDISDTEDATDLNIFTKIFGSKSKKTESTDSAPTRIDKDADVYNMNHYKRGWAIIFNHYQFDNELLESREGTEEDVDALEETFKFLQFDVTVCNDYSCAQIYDKLNEVAESSHTDFDCLLITVLTHGDKGNIYAKDFSYPPDMLWTPFTGDKCTTLAGKPKIFFIQACRGTKVDSGARAFFISRDSSAATYSIPSMADILVMYSSYEGYLSWRNPETGSWFIQCLCEELKSSAREKDLLLMLHRVNQKMALEFESNVPSTPEMDLKKQVGSIVSTFTRLLYFYP